MMSTVALRGATGTAMTRWAIARIADVAERGVALILHPVTSASGPVLRSVVLDRPKRLAPSGRRHLGHPGTTRTGAASLPVCG